MATLRACNFPKQVVTSRNSAIALQSAYKAKPCAISDSRVWRNSFGGLPVRRKATHRLQLRSLSLRRGAWRAEVGEENTDVTQEPVKSEESTSSTPKGFGSPKALVKDKKRPSSQSTSSSSGSIRRAPPSKPLFTTQEADQQALKTESRVVTFLGILFVVIIVQGLILAGSGFLPEEYDEIVAKWLYPAFTPTVGVFFTIAASYGLWKFSRGETGMGGS